MIEHHYTKPKPETPCTTANKEALAKERICEVCKKAYVPTGHNQKICPDCKDRPSRQKTEKVAEKLPELFPPAQGCNGTMSPPIEIRSPNEVIITIVNGSITIKVADNASSSH